MSDEAKKTIQDVSEQLFLAQTALAAEHPELAAEVERIMKELSELAGRVPA